MSKFSPRCTVRANRSAFLLERARDAAQLLVNKVFELPSESTDVGRVATIPDATTKMPREKVVPKERPQTKWEVRGARGVSLAAEPARMRWTPTDDCCALFRLPSARPLPRSRAL